MKKITWAYSGIKAFETCPRQFYYVRVRKEFREPESEAILYGNKFHKAAEKYVLGTNKLPLYDGFGFAKDVLDKLIAMPGGKLCEYKMGLTKELKPCEFFDKDVWFRTVADLIIIDGDVAKVIDYKTGANATYADKGQLELMALAVFIHFPKIKVVKAALLYVVCNAFIKETYEVEHTHELWAKWMGKYASYKQAHKDDVWNPRPSGLCRKHCIVTSCEHNGRAE